MHALDYHRQCARAENESDAMLGRWRYPLTYIVQRSYEVIHIFIVYAHFSTQVVLDSDSKTGVMASGACVN